MYMLMAVFNKYDLKNVLEDLFDNHIEGITVTDVIGKGAYGLVEGDLKPTDLFPKVKVEIVVSNEEYRDTAMECIRSNCHDLGRGAGKMWWVLIGGVERIRTGETNEDALTTQANKKVPNRMDLQTTAIDTPCS